MMLRPLHVRGWVLLACLQLGCGAAPDINQAYHTDPVEILRFAWEADQRKQEAETAAQVHRVLCQSDSRMVEYWAAERDRLHPPVQSVLDRLMASIRGLEPAPDTAWMAVFYWGWIVEIYTHPELTPAQAQVLAEQQCLRMGRRV